MPGSRLQYLDALRGFAVLLVILVHVGQCAPAGEWFVYWAQYGQYGVQLFFVVSAFSLVLARDRHATENYFDFMIHRFFRIAPMYYVALVLFLACTMLLERVRPDAVFFTPAREYTLGRVAANVLLIHGAVESANNNIVSGGGAIGCEFLFYVIFPVIVQLTAAQVRLLPVMAVVGCGCLMAATRLSSAVEAHRGFLYYNVLCQAPCFLFGVAAYNWREDRRFAWVIAGLAPLSFYPKFLSWMVSFWG